MDYFVSPTLKEAFEFSHSVSSREMLVIIGRCRIKYRGRAKSFLDFGDRLLIVKKDGSVLVHRDEKYTPVNWQPPGTRVEYSMDKDLFVLSAVRSNPPEKMVVEFERIQLMASTPLEDKAEMSITGMERDFVKRIIQDPNCIEEGFRLLREEKATYSGSIDLYGIDKEGNMVVIEVKRSQASPSAVIQLEAYIKDFKRKNSDVKVRGILVAPKIPPMIRRLLEDRGLEYRELEYEFELVEDKQRSLTEY
ncbi:MAG: endonuclease NucS [Candidatus Hydrothermarchaeaceae archaeon]